MVAQGVDVEAICLKLTLWEVLKDNPVTKGTFYGSALVKKKLQVQRVGAADTISFIPSCLSPGLAPQFPKMHPPPYVGLALTLFGVGQGDPL